MPSVALFEQASKVSWEDYFSLAPLSNLVKSRPNHSSIRSIKKWLRALRKLIKTAQSVEELVEAVATKRYTKARVRRLLTYILVQARENDLPEDIHVLGFYRKRQTTSQVSERAGPSSQPNWQRTFGML